MYRLSVIFLCFNLIGCTALDQAGVFVGGITDYFLGGEDNTAPPSELVEYEPEIEIKVLWKEDVGVGYDEQSVKLVPVVSAGKIITCDREGLIEARDRQTGDLIWEIETELPLSGCPGVGLDTVIVGSSNADVIALDLETGEKRWDTRVSSEVLAIPKVDNGTVIVRTTDGRITAFDEESGEELWGFERNVPPLSIRGVSDPIIYGDQVIVGFANGKVFALRLRDGKQIWETSAAIPKGRTEVERLIDLDADPVEADGVVFLAGYQGGIVAVLTLDGDVLWRSEEVSSYAGMNIDWRYLYVTDTNSNVWQLDQRNGAALWKQKDLLHRKLTAPATFENAVVVGDLEGYVHWLSNEDGRQLGRVQITDSSISAMPVVEDDMVYVYATDGTLAGITVQFP